MRRSSLALCLVACMALAGCLGPSSADWGTGSSSVQVDFSMENSTVTSGLSGQSTTLSGLYPVGCTPDAEGSVLEAKQGDPIRFSGYLAASHFYDQHDTLMGAKGLDYGVTTAVAIQSMPFEQAASVEDGEGARIDVKSWSLPLGPDTGAGSVDLDELDSDADTKWFILGLVPTSEDILSGMKSLGEWHQPVVIQGYLVEAADGKNPNGYLKSWHKTSSDCNMLVGDNNREDAYVFVTGISLEGASVTVSGEADDEWVQGDVPFLGRGGFIMFFLVGGLGGAVGLFIVSKGLVMKSASSTMQTLIGSEGMKKAASVKTDAKAAKKAGMESPTERKARQDKERAKEIKKEKPQPSAAPKNENPMGGFDLDSVLASTSTSKGPGGSAPGGRKSSVVVTEAAQEMDRMNAEESVSSSLPPSMTQRRSSPPTSSNVGGPPEPAAEPKKQPPVRRRKAVKKAEPVEEAAPAPAQHYEDEDEDFSDFSF
ncbi:MAG: hypothetical protein ACPHJD_02130 [Poseidonia sp.]